MDVCICVCFWVLVVSLRERVSFSRLLFVCLYMCLFVCLGGCGKWRCRNVGIFVGFKNDKRNNETVRGGACINVSTSTTQMMIAMIKDSR